ncbi:hypothetical protein V2H45_23920 [Tumidithrix elongata RA019]|uniref:Uncharacterized protein n=1 Tax=Tumidithrix elongata BACA0141 TaxID=2716417 RepID=A0AAW9PXR2_9CYAN|nr:hypothetical protein [Tumidithrix elongata RA019]
MMRSQKSIYWVVVAVGNAPYKIGDRTNHDPDFAIASIKKYKQKLYRLEFSAQILDWIC